VRRGFKRPARRLRGVTTDFIRAYRGDQFGPRDSCEGRLAMISFDTINRAAMAALPAVLARLLPGGKIIVRSGGIGGPEVSK
jgi:hypothetical protein